MPNPGTPISSILAAEMAKITVDAINFKDGVNLKSEDNILKISAPVQTASQGLLVGDDAQSISTTGSGFIMKDVKSGTNYSPITLGIKDQSVVGNRDSTGIIKPHYSEVATDLIPLQQGTGAAASGSVLYESTDTLDSAGRIFGLSPILEETILATDYIHYEIYDGVDQSGGIAYSPKPFTGIALNVGDYLDWWFGGYYEAPAGTTLNFRLTKSSTVDGPRTTLNVRASSVDPTTYYVLVQLRGFVTREMASTDTLSQLMKKYSTYVRADYTDGNSDGSKLRPYSDIQSAIAGSADGSTFLVDGFHDDFVYDPLKSAHMWFTKGSGFGYDIWNSANGYGAYQSDATCTKLYTIDGALIKNTGQYGIRSKKSDYFNVSNCQFENCGQDGLTVDLGALAHDGLWGYDSSASDLATNYANSDYGGGVMRIEESRTVVIFNNRQGYDDQNDKGSFRGFRIQNCGKDGWVDVKNNKCFNTMESPYYFASSTYDELNGCENVTFIGNYAKHAGNCPFLPIGGVKIFAKNNTFVECWNTEIGWSSSELILDGNVFDSISLSPNNAIGNTGDAHNASSAFAGIGQRAGTKYIATLTNNKFINDGAVAPDRIGFYLSSQVGQTLADKSVGIITLIGNEFNGHDVGLESDANLDNITLIEHGNIWINNGQNYKWNGSGSHYSKPFGNIITNVNTADFTKDAAENHIAVSEGETLIDTYKVNQLQAVAIGTKIRILLAGSSKIQFDDIPVAGCTIDGADVNATLATAINELNSYFQGVGTTGNAPIITSSINLSMNVGDSLNYELVGSDILAVEWDFSGQAGIINVIGNTRKLIGGSGLIAGTYSIPVTAINYFGTHSVTITLVITEVSSSYENTKSIRWFNNNYGVLVPTSSNPFYRLNDSAGLPYSVSFWFKSEGNQQQQQTIISFGEGDQGVRIEWAGTNSKKQLSLTIGGQNTDPHVKMKTPVGSIGNAQWYHILVTCNGGTTSGTTSAEKFGSFKIYVDGADQSLTTSALSDGYAGEIPVNVSGGYFMGRKVGSTSGHMRDCHVDELGLWNVELTSLEAVKLAVTPIDLEVDSGDYSSSAGLKHYYRMGDGDTFPTITDNKGTVNIVQNGMTAANTENEVPN